MGEDGNNLIVPPKQDFDTDSYQGSMQQILQENLGNYVIVEFLIGTGSLESRQGILYNVGSQFLVLYDDINLRYVICDVFAVKFVTFLLPGYRPGQIPSLMVAQEESALRSEGAAPQMETAAPARLPETEVNETQAVPASAMARRTPSQAAYQYAVRRRGGL